LVLIYLKEILEGNKAQKKSYFDFQTKIIYIMHF